MLRPMLGVALAALLCVAGGCGQNASTAESSSSKEETGGMPAEGASGPVESPTPARAVAEQPIAATAQEFVDALLKGDSGRAQQLLTPAAQQSFAQHGKAFPPPQGDIPRFTVDQIRKPSETDALVQCFVYTSATDGQEIKAEMCCIMRRVDDQWRVSGIARGAGANVQVVNFEAAPAPPQATTAAGGPPSQAGPPAQQLPQQNAVPQAGVAAPGAATFQGYGQQPTGPQGVAPVEGAASPSGPARQSPRTAEDLPAGPTR